MQRRMKVSEFMKRRIPQVQMAEILGVSESTISKDVKAVTEEWRNYMVRNADTIKARELVELDEMELAASKEWMKDHHVRWLRMRLDIKKRRADMLGLDSPIVNVHRHEVDKDLRDMSDDELNELWEELNDDDVALQLH